MNSRKALIILILAAIAILVFAAYYKWRTIRINAPETPNVPGQIIGPNSEPMVKGPIAPPY
ncbi:MAG TPA: hypothetical protein PKG74_01125 [Candidatus Colwellbacteria bacterium]|nr:hypothetical protein [Candidatus Colwellbacteria bacterium]